MAIVEWCGAVDRGRGREYGSRSAIPSQVYTVATALQLQALGATRTHRRLELLIVLLHRLVLESAGVDEILIHRVDIRLLLARLLLLFLRLGGV